jgi:DNA-binding GntR family transcriptional regulator
MELDFDFRIDRLAAIAPQINTLLHQAIVLVKLKPGQILKERELSETLEVSRTPIREALLRLADEGLVEIFPQAGTYVSRISVEAVRESQFIREAMEVATVRCVAQQATPEWLTKAERLVQQYSQAIEWGDYDVLFDLDEQFHRSIAEFRFRERLWKITNSAKSHMDRVRRLSLPYPGRRLEIVQEHGEVLRAISERDEVQAVEAMRAHLNTVFTDLERVRGEFSEYFVH